MTAQRRKLDVKKMKAEAFDGDDDKWDSWSFALKSGIRAQDAEAYRMITKIEQMKEELNEDNLGLEEDEISGELYNLLCQVCRGAAQSIIRSVDDCRGLTAWQKLSPKTVARTIQAWRRDQACKSSRCVKGRGGDQQVGRWIEEGEEGL